MIRFLNRVSELKNYMTVGFREEFPRNNHEQKFDVFVRLSVPGAQWFFGTEKYANSCKFANYADDKISMGYEETVSFFRHLTKDNNECRDITGKDFRFEIGWNLYIFDVRYQSKFSAPHLLEVTFFVTVEIEVSSYGGFALVLKY